MKTFSSLLLLLVLIGCSSTSGLQRRIAKNPGVLESLSPQDQELVAVGRIREGMSKEGVFLAWGRPSFQTAGSKSGVPFETWIYTDSVPRFHSSLGFGLAYGHGYGRGHYPHYGYGYGVHPYLGTHFQNVTVGKIEFLNNKVASWQGVYR